MTGALWAKAKPRAEAKTGAVQEVARVVESTPLKKAPEGAVAGGEFARRVHGPAAEGDFKDAKKIEGDEGDDRRLARKMGLPNCTPQPT